MGMGGAALRLQNLPIPWYGSLTQPLREISQVLAIFSAC